MIKYLTLIALSGCCITASATTVNWGQYERTPIDFTNVASDWSYTTFANAGDSGIDVRMNIIGTGFTGVSIGTAHYGYTSPRYGNGTPNLGLKFDANFANKGDSFTVSFEFYKNGERIAVDGVGLGILGIGIAQPNEGPHGWKKGWGAQKFRDVVSNVYAGHQGDRFYTGEGQSDKWALSLSSAINNASSNSVKPLEGGENYIDIDYAFQQGIYYGTGPDWNSDSNTSGNISAVYNAPADSISFTFGASDDNAVMDNGPYNQSFTIGGFNFGSEVIGSPPTRPGGQTPEPSTYALLIGAGMGALVLIRRRSRKA